MIQHFYSLLIPIIFLYFYLHLHSYHNRLTRVALEPFIWWTLLLKQGLRWTCAQEETSSSSGSLINHVKLDTFFSTSPTGNVILLLVFNRYSIAKLFFIYFISFILMVAAFHHKYTSRHPKQHGYKQKFSPRQAWNKHLFFFKKLTFSIVLLQ